MGVTVFYLGPTTVIEGVPLENLFTGVAYHRAGLTAPCKVVKVNGSGCSGLRKRYVHIEGDTWKYFSGATYHGIAAKYPYNIVRLIWSEFVGPSNSYIHRIWVLLTKKI